MYRGAKTFMSERKFYHEINFVRSIAALSVVLVHVTASNYSLNDKQLHWFVLFLNQITRYGTPFFAVISGFLLYNQAIKKQYNFKKFLSSRFTKVLIPFFIWSFIYLIVKIYSQGGASDFEGTKHFIYNFLFGKSWYHLYFIAVVVQFYLVFPLIQRFHSQKQLFVLTIIALYFNSFHIIMPLEVSNKLLYQIVNERAFILNWIYYFFLGGLLVHIWPKIISWIKKHSDIVIVLGFMAIIFTIYEYTYVDRILDSTKLTNLIHVPILFIMFTGLYFVIIKYQKLTSFFLWIGNRSMGIYLVHPLVIWYIRRNFTWLLEKSKYIPFTYLLILTLTIVLVQLIYRLPLGQYVVIVASRNRRNNSSNIRELSMK